MRNPRRRGRKSRHERRVERGSMRGEPRIIIPRGERDEVRFYAYRGFVVTWQRGKIVRVFELDASKTRSYSPLPAALVERVEQAIAKAR